MGAINNMLRPVLGLLLVVSIATAMQWDYEFGERNVQDFPMYEKQDEIGVASYHNYYTIPERPGAQLIYVHVTVWADTEPNVDFNTSTNTVEISYPQSENTVSTFRIKGRGVPFYN